ncbi:hypothetical protein AN963_21215 [Brevibacillus choshinensis]|uniref:Uncharacterized protein n=1 Tax=Brevibacillus choshinensis TaxID=54911 RepID=A0ABR5N0E7_BRECH|nr:hypothetical protein AN963_21215 [Brevibacillus choshinensis]
MDRKTDLQKRPPSRFFRRGAFGQAGNVPHVFDIRSTAVTFVLSMQAALTFLHVEEHFHGYGDTETIVCLMSSVTGNGGLLGAIFMKKCLRTSG